MTLLLYQKLNPDYTTVGVKQSDSCLSSWLLLYGLGAVDASKLITLVDDVLQVYCKHTR